MANNSGGNSIGVLGVLGVVFVVMKLMGYLHWSWFYVTLPFWGGLAIVISIILIAGIGAGGFLGITALFNKNKS